MKMTTTNSYSDRINDDDDDLTMMMMMMMLVVIGNLPVNFVRSLCYEEADLALPDEITTAGIYSKLAALRLRTAHRHKQDSKLRQAQSTKYQQQGWV